MNSNSLESDMKQYEDFIRNCKLVEEERLPQYETEILWTNDLSGVKVLEQLEKNKTAKMTTESQGSSKNCPFLDLKWTIELELLQVNNDGTLSHNDRIPLDKSVVLATTDASQPGPSNLALATKSDVASTGTSQSGRLRALRDGISRRIQGFRSGEVRRSLHKAPHQYVLLAVVKWVGPSEGGFSVVTAKLTIGRYSLVVREPLSAHFLAGNSFLLESTGALEWTHQYDPGHRVQGLNTQADWFRAFNSAQSLTLALTVQLNQQSMSKIGFPFAKFFAQPDKVEFDQVIAELRLANTDSKRVAVAGTDGCTYYIVKEDLSSASSYFRAFLDRWDQGDQGALQFPQVSPFSTCPDLIPFVVYFIARKTLLFGLSDNAADLIVAADALGMPELTRLAEIAAVPNISLDNVTRLIRLAWQFQAGLLFRAALIFLRVNYDEIWINNKEDLADLGRLLSSERFMSAFKTMAF